MKICLSCGTENVDKEQFCKFCGKPIHKEEISQSSPPEPIKEGEVR